MTILSPDRGATTSPFDVYAPQEDSRLLIGAMLASGLVYGRRVADLCSGSGVVALAAAAGGAKSVVAVDNCPSAVARARREAADGRLDIRVVLGSWLKAADYGSFDLIVCNPPYVPKPIDDDPGAMPSAAGPSSAYDAGPTGRLVLDPICLEAVRLLDIGGSLLVVQSEVADVPRSLRLLAESGLVANIVAQQHIPFGPVLSARAGWLKRIGRLPADARGEKLVVIRADKL